MSVWNGWDFNKVIYSHKIFFHAFNVLPDLEKTNLSIKEKRYSVEK